MKNKLTALLAGLLIFLTAPAFADLQISNNGTRAGQFRKINLPAGSSVNAAGDLTFNDGTAAGSFTTLTATTINAGTANAANSWTSTSNGIQYEGATADASETTVSVTDPTADRTITWPDASGMAVVSSLTTNAFDAANSVNLKSNGIEFEGATADSFETTLSPVDPTADQTVSIANAGVNNALVFSTLTTNTIDAANSMWFVSNGLVMEGATADTFEMTLSPADPTADQTVTFPNFAVNYALIGSSLTTNNIDAANSIWAESNTLAFEGATADAFETRVTVGDPTADQTDTIPATAGAAGTFELKGATVVITAGTTPTLTVPLGVDFIATDTIVTDNQDQTITFSSGGSLGQMCHIIFQTDSGGSNDEVITFQTTLTNTTGTLTLANLTANRYTVTFMSDGTVWNEVCRTGAQT